MARYEDPDPYTYTLIGSTPSVYGDVRSYRVDRDGKPLGVIRSTRISTDTKMGRLRRPGKGRSGFEAVIPLRHSRSGELLHPIGTLAALGSWTPGNAARRRDAAEELEQTAVRDDAMTPAFIDMAIAHYTNRTPRP